MATCFEQLPFKIRFCSVIIGNGTRFKQEWILLKGQWLPPLSVIFMEGEKKSIVFNGGEITRITKSRSNLLDYLAHWINHYSVGESGENINALEKYYFLHRYKIVKEKIVMKCDCLTPPRSVGTHNRLVSLPVDNTLSDIISEFSVSLLLPNLKRFLDFSNCSKMHCWREDGCLKVVLWENHAVLGKRAHMPVMCEYLCLNNTTSRSWSIISNWLIYVGIIILK